MDLHEFYQAGLAYDIYAIDGDDELAIRVQKTLIWHQLLEPPADGDFQTISIGALETFQKLVLSVPDLAAKYSGLDKEVGHLGRMTSKALIEILPETLPKPEMRLSDDLASRIIKYMDSKDYQIFTGEKEFNIVYVEGMNANGSLNDDSPDHFNDIRLVIEFRSGTPVIVGGPWEATTEPGAKWTRSPQNIAGAARIKFGQYKSWVMAWHKMPKSPASHEALYQEKPVTVYRDFNKDFKRTNDKEYTGLFGINQHWGYDQDRNNVAGASAGCLVGRTTQGHKDFIALLKQDRRYKDNKGYLFYTTIIPGNEIS